MMEEILAILMYLAEAILGIWFVVTMFASC